MAASGRLALLLALAAALACPAAAAADELPALALDDACSSADECSLSLRQLRGEAAEGGGAGAQLAEEAEATESEVAELAEESEDTREDQGEEASESKEPCCCMRGRTAKAGNCNPCTAQGCYPEGAVGIECGPGTIDRERVCSWYGRRRNSRPSWR